MSGSPMRVLIAGQEPGALNCSSCNFARVKIKLSFVVSLLRKMEGPLVVSSKHERFSFSWQLYLEKIYGRVLVSSKLERRSWGNSIGHVEKALQFKKRDRE